MIGLCGLAATGQEMTGSGNPLEALQALSAAVAAKEAEVDQLRASLQAAATTVEQEVIAQDLQREIGELRGLRQKFEESASGVDISLFIEEEKEPFSWQNQLGKILEPILEEMETATARSRKMAELNKAIQQFGKRHEVAAMAINRIRSHLGEAPEPALELALQKELEKWTQRDLVANNQKRAAEVQLEALEAERPGGLGGAAPYIRGFLSQRGLNLLYGIGSAFLVFVSLRLMLVLVRRIRRGEDQNSFASRVFVLLTNLLSVLGAIVALLIVFSAAGDLFLLGLVLIFLIGAAWAGIQVIPQFIESLKLILNIGMVKEGQRIEFDGIPWNVESLSFSCRLVNSELDDGLQVLPVKRLVGLHSRPWCVDEAAFPLRRGEWVALADGHSGRSIAQNPGMVTLEELGGALISYPSAEFLKLAPRNLSRGSFRVRTRFGIDYSHQAIAATQVPGLFHSQLEEGLPEVVGKEAIRAISVQLANAGPSSLDYEVEVDLDGSAAPLHRQAKFALQRLLVEACNRHQIGIPFTQVMLHQPQRHREDGHVVPKA